MRSVLITLLLFCVPLCTSVGCARVTLVPPALLHRAKAPPKLKVQRPSGPASRLHYPGGVVLGQLDLQTAGTPPSPAEQRAFHKAISAAIRQSFPARDPARPPLRVNIGYRYHLETRRMMALDVFHTLTLGLVFVTPEKGTAKAEVHLSVGAPEGTKGARGYHARLTVSTPYKSAFTPYYDRTTRQKYLNQTHLVAFRKIIAHLRWWLQRGLRTRLPTHASTAAAPSTPPSKKGAGSPKATSTARWYDLKLHVRGTSKEVWRRWRGQTIVAEEKVKVAERRTVFSKMLKLLGGLSVGYSFGSVWANSKVRDESGRRYNIASGRGMSHSVGVSLFRPPANSGIYFSPSVGFLWERFSIGDVAGIAKQNSAEGATDVPAIATDPDQPGRPELDLAAPWRYRLIMTSLHLGLRAGGVLLWGRKVQYFLGLEGGFNVVEWRWMDILWDRFRDRAHSFAAAGSFNGRLLTGITIRPWHLTFFVQVGYEYFRQFKYPQPIPFRGKMEYDTSLGVWQRPIQTAEALSLHALRIYCGAALVY